jgi:hypothetical protein
MTGPCQSELYTNLVAASDDCVNLQTPARSLGVKGTGACSQTEQITMHRATQVALNDLARIHRVCSVRAGIFQQKQLTLMLQQQQVMVADTEYLAVVGVKILGFFQKVISHAGQSIPVRGLIR